MARRYRVAKDRTLIDVQGSKLYGGGEEVSAEDAAGLNFPALVEGGFVEEIEPLVPCPACEADKSVKRKDVPNFKKAETLSEHYEKEHPALAAPDFEEVV